MTKPNEDLALAVLKKIEGGHWPSSKELNEAAAYLGRQEAAIDILRIKNDQLCAALGDFAKLGALGLHTPDTPILDYGSLQIPYSAFIRAAELLYKAPEATD